MPVQTRSKKTGSKTTSKFFDFPPINQIERILRKQKKNMEKLSKSGTFSASVSDENEDTMYEELTTTKISIPLLSKADISPPLPAKRTSSHPPIGKKIPPAKPPRRSSATPSYANASEAESFWRKAKRFSSYAFMWILYLLLFVAFIGGIERVYEICTSFFRNDTFEDRYGMILLDKKSMTYTKLN